MANIRVDLGHIIQDGIDLIFNAPCDCSEITGLTVYYPSQDTIISKTFTFRDAHKNNLGSLAGLFVKGARVKVNLDVTNGYAYIENADTNAYLENKFAEIISGGTPIKTIDGRTLQVFVGTKDEYGILTDEQKENLFAIITDDTTKDTLFNALETLQNNLKDGSLVPKKAEQDKNGRDISSTYYSLSPCLDTEILTSANLDNFTETGAYFIPYSNIVNGDITGLPYKLAEQFPTTESKGAILICEIKDDHSIVQTLKCIGAGAIRSLLFWRTTVIAQAGAIYGRWHRLVSDFELENGYFTVNSAKYATNDSDGNPINKTYLKTNAPTENIAKKLTETGYYYVSAYFVSEGLIFELANFGLIYWVRNASGFYSTVGLNKLFDPCFLNISSDGTMEVYVNGRTASDKLSGEYKILTAKLG